MVVVIVVVVVVVVIVAVTPTTKLFNNGRTSFQTIAFQGFSGRILDSVFFRNAKEYRYP
jgi:hypothetical protein